MHRICGALRSTGNCGPAPGACSDCTASGSPEIIPNLPNTSFDQGGLRCSGESACFNLSGTWKFQDSSNFLSCTGKDSCSSFFVGNVGAVCCDNVDNGGSGPCRSGNYALTTDPASTCTQDVCCSGRLSCSDNHQLKNVNSLYCEGAFTCQSLRAELSGDLFCYANGFGTCSSFKDIDTEFFFEANNDHQHCIQCISNGNVGTCLDVLFDFTAIPAAPATTVRMKCEGSNACTDSNITLTAGVTLYMHCDGGSTCSALNVNTSALGILGFGNCCVPLKMRSS